MSRSWGIEKYFLYEGGQHFDDNILGCDSHGWQTSNDQVAINKAYVQGIADAGVDMACFFDLAYKHGRYDWGFYSPNLDNHVSPKLKGLFIDHADWNDDNFVDQGDITTFVAAFITQDPMCDLNGDNIVDQGDLQSFTAQFLLATQ